MKLFLAPSRPMSLTLRDYFAGKALNGVIADPTVQVDPQTAAKACYEYADAMLAERGKE